MLCITRARAHGHLSGTDDHSLINGHTEINMVSNCSGKDEEYRVKKKSRRTYFALGRDERKRARMRVCAIFYKMILIIMAYARVF